MPLKLKPENFRNTKSVKELTPAQQRFLEIGAQLHDSELTPALARMLLRDARTKHAYSVTDTDAPEGTDPVVGIVTLEAPGDDVHIDTLVIDEQRRGQRLGAAALGLIEALANNNNAERITLNPVSDDAGRFYEAHGYQPDGDSGDGMLSKRL